MRWLSPLIPAAGTGRDKWHYWFAWKPVRIGITDTKVWLETVQRKYTFWPREDGGGVRRVEYELKETLFEEKLR